MMESLWAMNAEDEPWWEHTGMNNDITKPSASVWGSQHGPTLQLLSFKDSVDSLPVKLQAPRDQCDHVVLQFHLLIILQTKPWD